MATKFRDIFKKWVWSYTTEFNSERLCGANLTRSTAAAIAAEAARLWTTALKKIRCDGHDIFGCGWTLPTASIPSFGASLAEAFAVAIRDAGAYLIPGWCDADIRETAGVLAEASELARADVCTKGGDSVQYEHRYVELTEDRITNALMAAKTVACEGAKD